MIAEEGLILKYEKTLRRKDSIEDFLRDCKKLGTYDGEEAKKMRKELQETLKELNSMPISEAVKLSVVLVRKKHR